MNNKAILTLEDNKQDELARTHDWILRLESSTATEEDRDAFESWLSEDARNLEIYDRALTFRDALKQISVTDLDADIAAPSTAEKLTGFFDELRANLTLPLLGTSAALAALVMVVFWAPLSEEGKDIETVVAESSVFEYNTTIAEVRTINLTDDTVVTLGAASSMSVVYSPTQRIIQLTAGEAYFDVTPDASRPFAVNADSVSATAIGTAFEVRRMTEGYKVAVSEGVVRVSTPLIVDGEQTSVLLDQKLTAGEQVGVSNTGRMLAPERIAIDAVGAWRTNRLIYQGDKLSDLLSDANRYSDIPIVIAEGSEAIRDLKVRGAFLGSDIERLLETIEQILPIETDLSHDDKIIIKAKD